MFDFKQVQLQALERELGIAIKEPRQGIGFIFDKEPIEAELVEIRKSLQFPEETLGNVEAALKWFQKLDSQTLSEFGQKVNKLISDRNYDKNWFMAFGYYLLTDNNNIPKRMVPPRPEYYLKSD